MGPGRRSSCWPDGEPNVFYVCVCVCGQQERVAGSCVRVCGWGCVCVYAWVCVCVCVRVLVSLLSCHCQLTAAAWTGTARTLRHVCIFYIRVCASVCARERVPLRQQDDVYLTHKDEPEAARRRRRRLTRAHRPNYLLLRRRPPPHSLPQGLASKVTTGQDIHLSIFSLRGGSCPPSVCCCGQPQCRALIKSCW